MNPFDWYIFHLVKQEIIILLLKILVYTCIYIDRINYVSISEIQISSKTKNLDPQG